MIITWAGTRPQKSCFSRSNKMGLGGNELSHPELEEISRRRQRTEEEKWMKEVGEEETSTTKEMKHSEVKVPGYVGSTLTFVLVFFMAATIRGKQFVYL